MASVKKFKKFIKRLENEDDIEIPNNLVEPIIEYLTHGAKKVELITGKDIDIAFEESGIDWRKTVKYVAFYIVNMYAINYVDIKVNFLDKKGKRVGPEDCSDLTDMMLDIISDPHEVLVTGGGELLINCFEPKLRELFEKNGIKFAQQEDDDIIELEPRYRPISYANDDT